MGTGPILFGEQSGRNPQQPPPSCGFFYIFCWFTGVPEYRPCARFSAPLLRPEPSISGVWSSGLHNDPPEVPRVLHFPRSRKGAWHFRGIIVQNEAQSTRGVLLPRVRSGVPVTIRSLVIELLGYPNAEGGRSMPSGRRTQQDTETGSGSGRANAANPGSCIVLPNR